MTPVDPGRLGLSGERLEHLSRWGAALVADGKLAGISTLVARHGEVAHLACHGMADLATGTAMAPDTICRIYSMTKPITSVAVMMLHEEARFQLDDPISRFIPEFRDMRVLVGGSRLRQTLEPAQRPITIRDLLIHTAGLTYGFLEASPVDALYRQNGIEFQTSDATLAELVSRVADLPLLSQPGQAWNYSIATDVLGHLVAVVSGIEFGDFLRSRILAPLGMTDTDFLVPESKDARFAANYTRHPKDGRLVPIDPAMVGRFTQPRAIASGGGGLVGTAPDYLRFCRMILGHGELDGVRLLGRKTVDLMLADHAGPAMVGPGLMRLGGGQAGIGFGLGFAVLVDPAAAQITGSVGEAAWSGAASTAFFIDPLEDMAVILMTQFMPAGTYPLQRDLRVLTYQALK
jgi:CubicO group peptidase (beta-lactamase class C family)